jgi:hypothetical protein
MNITVVAPLQFVGQIPGVLKVNRYQAITKVPTTSTANVADSNTAPYRLSAFARYRYRQGEAAKQPIYIGRAYWLYFICRQNPQADTLLDFASQRNHWIFPQSCPQTLSFSG